MSLGCSCSCRTHAAVAVALKYRLCYRLPNQFRIDAPPAWTRGGGRAIRIFALKMQCCGNMSVDLFSHLHPTVLSASLTVNLSSRRCLTCAACGSFWSFRLISPTPSQTPHPRCYRLSLLPKRYFPSRYAKHHSLRRTSDFCFHVKCFQVILNISPPLGPGGRWESETRETHLHPLVFYP